jgi:nucleoside triphosphate pyrophosphatase
MVEQGRPEPCPTGFTILIRGMELVLASGSPRRRELLRIARIAFTVRPADVDEQPLADEEPDAYVLRLAAAKARSVWRPGELTLGADTVVTVDGLLLGKPLDAADAGRMLRLLSGRTHQVLTGVCLYDGASARTAVETTAVEFLEMSDAEIDAYVASGEPFDKAGAYGIQGEASKFVARVEGCYFNVVGLPLARVYSFIRSILR